MAKYLQTVLSILFIIVPVVNSFQLPHLESIANVFGNFFGSDESENERVKRQSSGDECSDTFESCSSTLPRVQGEDEINFRYMPTIANGHIGFIPYRPVMFMSGLYTGQGGNSHRAQIPNIIMGQIKLPSADLERTARRYYKFNAKEGTFVEEIECEFAYIYHTMYVHQKYTKLLVSDIYAKRKTNIPGGGTIHMDFPEDIDSPDIDFDEKTDHHANWKVKGTTMESEDGDEQNKQNIHIFYTHPIREISVRGLERNETMVMAIDRQHSAAQNEFDEALRIVYDPRGGGAHNLLKSHIEAWRQVWDGGSVEVKGSSLVAKITNFAQYNLFSNLPALNPNQEPQQSEFHFGVARSGLGHGSLGKNHQGHVMWDSEMYVLPAVLVFHPELAKKMLRYRAALFQQAKENAKQRDEKGVRYPWESAYTGIEVTPDNTCDGCAARQIHVNGAVAWGIRQYFSLTRDQNFISDQYYTPCEIMKEIAHFYADKAKYSNKDGRYTIKNVMGPDDYHDHVDNNAYTNVIASLAIHYARYLTCMCGGSVRKEVPDEWLQVALYLELPYNNKKRLHYAYDGFKGSRNTTVKQADTLLLGYPLNWNMSRDIMKNDLRFYEDELDSVSPAMTYSFMVVAWKFAEEYSKMVSDFHKSYQDYLIQPFKVWTEYNEAERADRERSTVNFLPGMGAFIQSIVYGFAGVRVRPEQLEFHNPQVPPDAQELVLKGFKYMGASMTITIYQDQRVDIEVHYIGDYQLVLQKNTSRGRESLREGDVITIRDGKKGFFIFTERGTPCDHPRDYIYMPWGYSPWISAADTLNIAHPLVPVLVFIVVYHIINAGLVNVVTGFVIT